MVEKRSSTLVSALTWPNRALFEALPRTGTPAFQRDVRGPLAALLLGRTSELDRGLVASYRRGGLYHLLVVSGLHIVLEAGLVSFALSLLRIEGKRRDVFLLGSVFFFVLVGGANPPAVRAGLVVGVFLLTRLLERPIGSAQAIGLSALVLFLADPAAMFSVGTILTFAAVCGIALFSNPIRERLPSRPEWLWSGLAGTLAAEAATAPVLFWRFNLVAAGAWVTSPAAIPLSAGLIAVGGALLLFYALGIPAGLLESLFALGSRGLEWLAERSTGAAFLRPTPPLWAMLLAGGLLGAAALGPRLFRRPFAVSAAGGLRPLRPAARSFRPRARLFDRGPRRRPGRRDTASLEQEGDSGRRRGTLRCGGDRIRTDAGAAKAPRPGRDAARCGAPDAPASGSRARPVRHSRGAPGRGALAFRWSGRERVPRRPDGPRRPTRSPDAPSSHRRRARARRSAHLRSALGRPDAQERRRQQSVGRRSRRAATGAPRC